VNQCVFCDGRLRLFAVPGERGVRAWLCPVCDAEHASELLDITGQEEKRCYLCKTYAVREGGRGLCQHCAALARPCP
jgi:hypothetical protein